MLQLPTKQGTKKKEDCKQVNVNVRNAGFEILKVRKEMYWTYCSSSKRHTMHFGE